MRTIVYVDGFNLYFRALKDRPRYKWLNPLALSQSILAARNTVNRVRYYTARVSGRLDADAPRRQERYLKALRSVPEISIHMGNFLSSEKWAGLVHPPQTIPRVTIPKPWPNVVRVHKIEEKGSDVNLGVHLVRDELSKPVGLICPSGKPAAGLKKVATFVRLIREHDLRRSQFPDPLPGTAIRRPIEWK